MSKDQVSVKVNLLGYVKTSEVQPEDREAALVLGFTREVLTIIFILSIHLHISQGFWGFGRTSVFSFFYNRGD